MSSYILLFCSTIAAILGILISRSEKLKNHKLFGLNTSGLILCIISLIAFIVSFRDISYKNTIANEKSKLETEKLILISNQADAAIQPPFTFLNNFLSFNGHSELIKILNKDIQDEPGKDHPNHKEIEPIMEVFKSVSVFNTSTMTFNGKKLTWLENMLYDLKNTYYLCDELLKCYGDTNHQLISTIDEIKNRSEELFFILNTAATYPGIKDSYVGGIPREQDLDFIRHYFLRCLKAKRLIHEIQKKQ
jgi:hypothetical protein